MSSSVKDWFRAYHVQGIMDPGLRKEFISRCRAGERYFFMSPNGDLFPCMVMAKKIGNLREVKEWDELFKGDIDADVRRAVRGCTEDCWMVCNTRSLIISHPFKAGYWVLKNKIGSHVHK
jgi:radical SAM protein with 4Fe4S-binding SPASM domain